MNGKPTNGNGYALKLVGAILAVVISALAWAGSAVVAHEMQIGILNERTETQSEMLRDMDRKLDKLLERKP